MGKPAHVTVNRWLQTAHLSQILFALICYLPMRFVYVVVVSAALLYNISMIHKLFNPFDHDFSIYQSLLFTFDNASKGAILYLLEVFHVNFAVGMAFDPLKYPLFAIVVVLFRLLVLMTSLAFAFTILKCIVFRVLGWEPERAGQA